MESIEEGEKKPPSWEPSQDPSGAIPIPVKQLAAILLSGFVKVVLMCITLLNFPFFFWFSPLTFVFPFTVSVTTRRS